MEGYQLVPIDQVIESPTNPRRSFKGMEELTESIKGKGVLMPALVRVQNDCFEIISGARRYRAAIAAGKTEFPVIIRNVTDDEALEIQVLENLQRENVHPLEEAWGYKSLLDRPGYDVAAIAVKVSKSETYVYQRLKLADLIKPVQESFLDERITSAHALLIARLQPADQEKAFEHCFESWGDHNLQSAKTLSAYIEREIHLDLKGVPFKLTDDELVLEAGSCINCSKRTGFVPQLFPDIAKKDTCTDGACFRLKIQAHIQRTVEKSEKKKIDLLRVSSNWHEENPKYLPASKYKVLDKNAPECATTKKAIIVEGMDQGKTITICTDQKCKMHWNTERATNSPGMSKEQRQEADPQSEKNKREKATRIAIFDAIIDRYKEDAWTRNEWELVASTLMQNQCDGFGGNALEFIAGRRGWSEESEGSSFDFLLPLLCTLPIEDLASFILELCIAPIAVESFPDETASRFLENQAKHFKVDLKKIEEQIEAKFAEQKKPAAETKSKKKSKAA